ncbi:MAG TPA: 2-oxoglutarate dehydrogenase, E2 component, dihydrolipoamide succinyltransferase [Jatrophihabitantaceae bacterium]|jgi:pyruvate dehydrogenase E2 component (dihydrolipoamide acetyltransferase)|nr:2-oxoglutarate dehydrogenase, E2 component, dihydrolipoamide succinyltransferase [Jatrophihabitantaceae bacterium]
MSVSVTMPRLGESVTEGTVTRWLKKEGERIEADEPLLEVSTDKVDTEVPSPASGVLTSIKVAEDETVDIGVELAIIGDSEEGAEPAAEKAAPEPEAKAEPEAEEKEPEPEAEPEAKAAPEPEAKAEPEPEPASQPAAPAQPQAEAPAAPSAVSADDEDVAGAYVTPLVRKLAGEHGVDLTSVSGTGVGGRIRKSDVLAAAAAAAAPPAAPATTAPAPATAPGTTAAAPAAPSPAATAAAALRGRTEKLSRRRAVIAARMVESLQTSAQLTTVVEADVTKVARLREAARADFEAREGVKLSFLPFFVQATVEALKAHPGLNSSVDTNEGTVTYHDTVNLGIAVDTEQGLIVPVLLAAGDLNLGGTARKIADLAERTRANKISPDELSGGTFTLTNTGSRGALFDTPIINQPQVGILGTGSVVKRAVVISDPNFGETIAVRSMVYLALTYDHRIVDGADAARFLTTVKDRLETGAFEGELGLS